MDTHASPSEAGTSAGTTRQARNQRILRFHSKRANRDGQPRATDWRSSLRESGGRYVGDELGVITALRLAPELQQLVRFNEFSLRVEFWRAPDWRDASVGDPWTDDDDLALQVYLQRLKIDVRQRGIVADTIAAIARESAYHPVREFLSAVTWDNSPRLDSWLRDLLHADGQPAYLQAVGSRFLISMVARVLDPGCKVDHALVLEGEQGVGKSSIARQLAVRSEWFCDDMPDLHSKDSAIQLCGKLVIELAELAAIRRSAEVESVKAFISRAQDTYRPPYARRTVSVPRQCVFIGTTNEREYLRDRTGNRRFWPVRLSGRVDLELLARHRDQLLAEAVHRFRTREQWHLTNDEAALATSEQQDRLLMTVLESDVTDYLLRMEAQGVRELSMKQVMTDALHLDSHASDFAERAGRLGPQVASALDQTGWRKVATVGRGINRRTIYRKAESSQGLTWQR
jgi:putative DNA primase/helicase